MPAEVLCLHFDTAHSRIAIRCPFPDKVKNPQVAVTGKRIAIVTIVAIHYVGRQPGQSQLPAIAVSHIAADVGKYSDGAGASFIIGSRRKSTAPVQLRTQFDEQRGRRDPPRLNSVSDVLPAKKCLVWQGAV